MTPLPAGKLKHYEDGGSVYQPLAHQCMGYHPNASKAHLILLMLEDVYASSDVNIVMMMFFELFYSEKFSQAGLEPTTF